MNKNISVTGEIVSAFLNLDYGKMKALVRDGLDSRIPPQDILKAMQQGMAAVGGKYEAREYFLSELMAAGEMMKAGLEELSPHLDVGSMRAAGIVVIGTVKGDLHDIGKNLVKSLLQSSGFTVHDLGIDVTPEAFISKVKEVNPDVLAMSALLTTTMGEMGVVIEQLKGTDLRGRVKVIVGGNSVTEEFGREIGAHAATKDAMAGVRICREWVKR